MPSPPMIIFLPVRNGGAYLTEAIDSIRAQTNADWRLVVMENCSVDDTIARATCHGDPRITIRAADSSLDIRSNFQRAVPYLEAEVRDNPLMTFIGHDDLLAPDYIERILALAAAHPSATLYQTHFDMVDAAGARIRACRPIAERESWTDLAAMLCWGLRDSFGTGYAFRARDFLRVGGWPDLPRLLYSDHLLFVRLARLGYKAASPVVDCSYRLHADSASGAHGRAYFQAFILALDAFVATLETEMADFVAEQRGIDALHSMLGRELGRYHLFPVAELLDDTGRAALERLKDRLATIDDRLLPTVWKHAYGGRLGKARQLIAHIRFRRATRDG